MKNKDEKKPLSYNLSLKNHQRLKDAAEAKKWSASLWLDEHLNVLFGNNDVTDLIPKEMIITARPPFNQAKPKSIKLMSTEEFEAVWTIYEKKGNKKTSQTAFNKLSKANKILLSEYLPKYVKATPNKQYRLNFQKFIKQEAWNDTLPLVVDKYGKQDVPRSAAYIAPTFSDTQAEQEKERLAEEQRKRNQERLKNSTRNLWTS
jgi:hypothetical protein